MGIGCLSMWILVAATPFAAASVAVAADAAGAGTQSARQPAKARPSLEARLQRQEDVEAIRRLLREYGRTLDARNLRGYADLFAVDGEWIGGFGSVKGREAIAPFMEKNMAAPLSSVEGAAAAAAPARPGPRGVHLMTNEIIEVDGDRATAWSKWTYITRSAENRPSMALEGHYDDQLVRENGQWKFQRRVVTADIPFSDPLAPAQPATPAR
jgi:uncharacterized protein (TIGR02246 family)